MNKLMSKPEYDALQYFVSPVQRYNSPTVSAKKTLRFLYNPDLILT